MARGARCTHGSVCWLLAVSQDRGAGSGLASLTIESLSAKEAAMNEALGEVRVACGRAIALGCLVKARRRTHVQPRPRTHRETRLSLLWMRTPSPHPHIHTLWTVVQSAVALCTDAERGEVSSSPGEDR